MSCSNNEEPTKSAEVLAKVTTSFYDTHKIEAAYPSNALNPYDIAGILHVELYKAYYEEDSLDNAIPAITDRVLLLANQSEAFGSLSSLPYSINIEAVTQLSEQITCCTSEILTNSLLSSEASVSLQNFIYTIVPLCNDEDDYTVLYSLITSYENTVLEAKNMPISDKQVLLITSSVVRYAAYERKKKPKKNTDPDWDLMIWRIVGSVSGATEGIEKAVVYAVIFGVLENGE